MARAERRLTSAAELNQLKAFVPKSDTSRHRKFETLLNALALGVEIASDIEVIAHTRAEMMKAARKEAGLQDELPNRALSTDEVERLQDSLKKRGEEVASGDSHSD